jgi:hypothetical protein
MVWFVILFLWGCGHEDPAPKVPLAAGPSVSEGAEEQAPFFDWKLVPLADPGKYSVELFWKRGNVLAGEIWVERTDSRGKSEVIARLAPNETHYEVSGAEFQAGETYHYRVIAVDDGNWVALGGCRAEIPTDLVLETGVYFWTPRDLGRLYLKKGAIIRTGAEDFTLSLLELYSDNAVIETFGSDEHALPGAAGRAGGKISLKVGKARGALTIVSRGEKGGDGADGAPGSEGAPGANASPEIRSFDQSAWVLDSLPSSGHTPRKEGYFPISKVRGNAGEGAPGGPGIDGTPGMPGGDSGGVVLEVNEAAGFLPTVLSVGGRGGTGGSGGVGGAGGPGGTVPDLPALPNPLVGGKSGPKGPDGKMGPPGADGKAGAVRARIGGVDVAL